MPEDAGLLQEPAISDAIQRFCALTGRRPDVLHVFRFDGWTTTDEAGLSVEEQIVRIGQELFEGAWRGVPPTDCVVEAPFGLYSFSEDRSPILLPKWLASATYAVPPRDPEHPLICGFLKVRNEIIHEGNLYRVLENLRRFCDVIVACDDASADGSHEVLEKGVDHLITIPETEHDFQRELEVKQRMLEVVHEKVKPAWICWLDADEELCEDGCEAIRGFCQAALSEPHEAYRFRYAQLWRGADWERIDGDFDKGRFIKLWRWSPELRFEQAYGTHKSQIPLAILARGLIADGPPWRVLHYGNCGANLALKCTQYWGGLGDVARHMNLNGAVYRPVSPEACLGLVPRPEPFSIEQTVNILALENLTRTPGLFAVVIPTYNRAGFLPRALASLLLQSYKRWIALVVDDGSTDETPLVMRRWQDLDPRIFYIRGRDHRGAVHANEIGMGLACQMAAWWTRLGSDDYFEPGKLELDACALEAHDVCYGPYRTLRGGQSAEYGNGPLSQSEIHARLARGEFAVSWANIAARTSILRKVREKHGAFCDPRLRTMEDFLINARIANVTESWVWRGRRRAGDVCIGTARAGEWPLGFMHDAVWRRSLIDSASADEVTTQAEHKLTRLIIRGMSAQAPASTLEHAKSFWKRASTYPLDKEACYPEHAIASGFDALVDLEILEYGCGNGSDARSLLRCGNRVTYCDIVPANVAEATRKIDAAGLSARATPCVLKDSSLAPIQSGSHDVVYSHGVIHHIADPLPVLREFHRVLRPHGRLVLMLYTERLAARLADVVQELMANGLTHEQAFGAATDGSGCPYARFYTEDEGRALLESAGFQLERAQLYNEDCFRVFFARRL